MAMPYCEHLMNILIVLSLLYEIGSLFKGFDLVFDRVGSDTLVHDFICKVKAIIGSTTLFLMELFGTIS